MIVTPSIEWRAAEQLMFGGAVGPQLLAWPVPLVVIIIGLMVTSGVVSGYVALFAWQRWSIPEAIEPGVLALASGWRSSGYFPEFIVADVAPELTFADLQWVGVFVAPITWFFFVLPYAGRD